MSGLRYNHLFIAILLTCAGCAFFLPPRWSHAPKGRLDSLLAPVAMPLRWAAQGIRQGLTESLGPTRSAAADAPVLELRAQIASLSMQVQRLERLAASRELAGDAGRYSQPFRVMWADGGARQSLLLAGGQADGLEEGMPVHYRGMILGRIVWVGPGSSRVVLLSDRGSTATAVFGHFERPAEGGPERWVRRSTPPPLVEGRGNGLMAVLNLSLEQIEAGQVSEGDWVALADEDWPLVVNGLLLGQVHRIRPQQSAALFAEVLIRPGVAAANLRQVMVMTGRPIAEGHGDAVGAAATGR